MTPARTCTHALAAWLTILACLQLCFTHADVYDKTTWCDGQPYSCATLDAARVKMREMASLLKWDNIDEDAQLAEYVWQSPEMTDLLLESAKRSVRRRRKRKLQRFDRFITKWDRLIPFTFDDNVPSTGRDVVRAAVRHLELHTCIRFEERNYTTALARSNHQSHIKFQSGTRCASYIGKIRPMMQPIELGSKCLARGIGVAVHEIGHTLGLWHEHQRSDRDRHVTIHQENLIPSFSSYASFIVIGDTNNVLPYDYGSIMHYNAHANSLNGNITVDPLDKLYLNTIGQEHGLSFLDAKTLNLAYCADVCHSEPDLPTCHNRGYPDPNDCRRCRCPDGFSGRHCDQLAPPVNAACGGAVSLGETGWEEVSSPHYDDRLTYDDQTSCTWLVEAPIGHHVVISFDGPRFGLLCATGRGTLCWHFVELRYRADLSETGPRFCCHTKPELTLRSDGQKVMILFRSNYTFPSNRTHGFKIRLHAERDSDREPGLVDPDLKSVTPPTAATTAENGKGGAVIDVAFLLDSSGGVGASDWRRYVLDFAQRVARSFVVGATRAQFGAVAFGSRAVLAVPLVKSRSGDVLDRALAGVKWQRGFSNATGGLRVVADDFFSVWRGGRRGVPRLVVLVTDGPLQARYDADRTAAVDALRRRGVGVLVVLVGDAVTRRQAADMTSRQPRVIKVTQFDRLESVVPDVVALIRATADVIILEEVTPKTKLPPGATTITVPPDTTPEPRETTRELIDLTFVLDSSGSVGDDGWRLVKSFVKGVVGHFRIGADDVRVGVVTFSLEARVALPLGGAGGDRDAVYRRVDAAEWMDNWSNTAGGLRAMRQQLYSGAQDRKEAPNVCVLLTDGPSNWNASLTVPEAARARAAGIRLLVVAVTTHVDIEEVHGVASRPRPDNEFFVDRFDELQSSVEAVSDRLHILAAHIQVPKVTSSTTTATLSTTTTTPSTTATTPSTTTTTRSTSTTTPSTTATTPSTTTTTLPTTTTTPSTTTTIPTTTLTTSSTTTTTPTTTTTTPSTTTTTPSTTTTTPTTTTTTPSTTTTTPTTTTTTSSTSTTTPTTTTNTPSAMTSTPITTTTTPTPTTTTSSTTTTTPTTTTTTTTSSTTTTAPTTTTTTPSTTKTTPLTIPTTTASSTTTTSQTTTTTPSTTTTTPSTTTTTPSTTTFSHTTTPDIGLHGNGTPIPDAAGDAWRCDFETEAGRGVWCGMTQSRSDQFDWTLQRGKTRSQFTGPLGAFGGSHYIYIEASSPRVPGDTATVYVSPRRTGNHCLRFHVSAYGFHVGRLDVFVTSRDDDVIFRLTGDQGPGWRAKAVSLELRSDTDRIAFRGVRGGEYSGDIALDSIRLGAGEC